MTEDGASDKDGRKDRSMSAVKSSREERLAAALRENLRKRKAQARSREGGDGG